MHRCLFVTLSVVALAACAPPRQGPTPRPEPSLAQAWTWPTTEQANAGMPAADAQGTAAVLDHGDVVLLDDKGHPLWQVTPRPRLYDAAPLFDNDLVVVASDHGLVALDRATGATRWEADLGDRGSTPVVVGDRLVATTWSQRFAAVDRGTGTGAWALDLPGRVFDPPASAAGLAVATWDDGASAGIVAVEVASGRVQWAAPVVGGGVSGAAVVDGKVIVVTGDAAAHAYDAATGEARWRVAMPGPGAPEVPPVAVERGGVAVADRDGDLAILDAASGSRRWSVRGVGAAVRGGPLGLRSGVVALPVDDGRLLVARAGKVVAVLDPPGRVMGLAATAPDQLVLATRESPDNIIGAWVWRP